MHSLTFSPGTDQAQKAEYNVPAQKDQDDVGNDVT